MIYLNGEFIEKFEATVPVSDRGVLYGDGLFETMRAYGGKVFRIGEHLKRLARSARALRIPLGVRPTELEETVTELLRLNSLTDAYVRITLTRGLHTGDLGLDTGQPPTLFITTREHHGYSDIMYQHGMKLTIAVAVRHSKSPLGRHKTLNYLENLLARDAAKENGFDEIIFLDENGCVVECATSNLFFVLNGDLCTPSAEMNVLGGITRDVVMEQARWNGRKVLERKWPFREFQQAEEAFLTNSIMEIMPVCEVAEERIGDACPGEVTKELTADYKRLVQEECGENMGT